MGCGVRVTAPVGLGVCMQLAGTAECHGGLVVCVGGGHVCVCVDIVWCVQHAA